MSQAMILQRLMELGIGNLHPVFDRGVRGGTLASRSLAGQTLENVKEDGIRTIIDLRTADHNDRLEMRCKDVGLAYHHIPVDAAVRSPEVLYADLSLLFGLLDEDGFYISCQQGFHRTDIALALYYFFHNDREVPEMVGHYKRGVLRCADIMRRVNMMRPFFQEVDEALFLQRRKRFLAFNREMAEKYKDVKVCCFIVQEGIMQMKIQCLPRKWFEIIKGTVLEEQMLAQNKVVSIQSRSGHDSVPPFSEEALKSPNFVGGRMG